MIRKYFKVLLLLFPMALTAQSLQPQNWILPEEQGPVYKLNLTIQSDFQEDQSIRLIFSDSRISTPMEQIRLPADSSVSIPLELNLQGYKDPIDFLVIIHFLPSGKSLFFPVMSHSIDESTDSVPELTSSENQLEYFYSPSCGDCLDFIEKELPQIEKELAMDLDILKWDLLTVPAMERLELISNGAIPRKVPLVYYQGILLAGEASIHKDLKNLLKGELHHPDEVPILQKGLTFLPVAAAGLLDGVNPCAFSTLLFLLSFLTLSKRKKRTLLLTGLSFTLSVGITYYLIGLGLFHGLRRAGSFQVVSMIINGAFILLLTVLTILSLRDYSLVRRGMIKDISLQLPSRIKDRMKGWIKKEHKRDFGILSGFLLGFLISIYELGCTGQIYLPTLAYMVETGGSGAGLLAVYNLAFILPLLLVFLLAYRGVSSQRFIEWFQNHLALSKLLMALFFAAMAVLLLLRIL